MIDTVTINGLQFKINGREMAETKSTVFEAEMAEMESKSTVFEAALAALPWLEEVFVQNEPSYNDRYLYFKLLKDNTNKLRRIGTIDYKDFCYYVSSCDSGTNRFLQKTVKPCNRVRIHGLPGLNLTSDILETAGKISQIVLTSLMIDQSMDL